MNPTHRFILRIIPYLAILLALPAAAQFGQIIYPDDGVIVNGGTSILARQLNTSFRVSQIGSVRFEYSSDGVSWNLIEVNDSQGNGIRSQSPLDWETFWDAEGLAAGSYMIRAKFFLKNGLIFSAPSIHVILNPPPAALVAGTISPDLLASLSGTGSTDSNGFINAWAWDFGDGTSAAGPTVTHSFAPGSSYIVTLTVTDNQGGLASDYVEVFTSPTPQIAPAQDCKPQSIQLRTTGKALGADGKGSGWGGTKGEDDGKTLGPLHKNPEDKGGYTGYAFEIAGTIKGNPKLCREIQLVRSTYITGADEYSKDECLKKPGGQFRDDLHFCTYSGAWTGSSNDYDGDGTLDLDLSDAVRCKAQGGTFKVSPGKPGKCANAPFPALFPSPVSYKPDEPFENEKGGAYREPRPKGNWKTHVNQQILWYDTPAVTGFKDGYNSYVIFVSLIRSANAPYTYCYESFYVQYEVGRADSEVIQETKSECNVDKSKVPGLN